MEPRGVNNRIEARKMTQDNARQPPRAAIVAHPGLWRSLGSKMEAQSGPKSTKNRLRNRSFLNSFWYRSFFKFWSKMGPTIDEKSIEKLLKDQCK